MADEYGDKSEPASPRKRDKARKEGQFARSPDLANAIILMAGLWGLGWLGSSLFAALRQMMELWLAHADGTRAAGQVFLQYGPASFFPVAKTVVSLMSVLFAAALLGGVLQAGLHLEPELLMPKWERLNFLSGFKRFFSLNALASTVFGVLKILALGWAAYRVVYLVSQTAPMLWHLPLGQLVEYSSEKVLGLGWTVAELMLLLGLADYGYRYWKHEHDLKMTKEEAKEEARMSDGSPEIKSRIKQVRREQHLRRMMQAVPKATVVITNPTHVAIALRYEPGSDGAPICVAKGENLLAERIKAIAREHAVPIVEEPPLARALLRTVQVGQEIPVEFYRAVAEILALLMRQRHGAARPNAALAGRAA